MKLIYYTTAYYASHGGSTHSRHFFTEVKKNPIVKNVIIFPLSKPSASVTKSKGGIRDWLRKNSLFQIFFFYRRNTFYFTDLVNYITEMKPDAIVIRLDSNFLQINKLRKIFPSLLIATEVNASPFDESFKNIALRPFFTSQERKSLQQTNINFFVSKRLRSSIMRSDLHPDRDYVVHNGVDTDTFKPSLSKRSETRKYLNLSNDALVVGYIGTLDIHKNLSNLINAFSEFRKHKPNARLLVVGDGPDKDNINKLVDELGLSSFIIFTGWCSHNEVPNYLNCFDIAIHHCAGNYMSPLKIFEYMACKLPVIGPATEAVQEIFIDGQHLLITNGKADDIEKKLMMIEENSVLRNELAQGGFDLVTSRYTWKRNADCIISIISEKITA